MPEQQPSRFRTWGGARPGAGRPPSSGALPHLGRKRVAPYQPVHVTLRVADHVWNLRSERSYAVIHRALEASRRRRDVRVVHFSIQGNHLHLIVEADGTRALSNTVRALSIRIARGLNRMMGRRGAVFADRFHARVLSTPAEVRNAIRYVIGNYASHAARRGEPMRDGWVDPFSSATVKMPRAAQGVLLAEAVTREGETWLLVLTRLGSERRVDARDGRSWGLRGNVDVRRGVPLDAGSRPRTWRARSLQVASTGLELRAAEGRPLLVREREKLVGVMVRGSPRAVFDAASGQGYGGDFRPEEPPVLPMRSDPRLRT